tara:strand:- start:3463 stop:4077 length:615 start_codon:yes stop_codon:yes gene_type:complete
MKYFLSFLITFTPIFINSQNDHDAKKLVEEVSSKISNAKTAVINFTFEKQEILYENGIIEIKDGKYRLTFMNVEQISDSKNIYTIIDENKEILISKVSEEDNFLKPSNLLNFFEDGYYYQNTFSNDNKKNTQLILTPIEKNSDKLKILMTINPEKKEILEIIEYDKSNNKTVIKINSILFNSMIENEKFVFYKSKYPGYHIEQF